MVKFCDLPLEILLDITERAAAADLEPTTPTKEEDSSRHGPRRSSSSSTTTISSLSLVCRYLNGVTARKLFRTYRLQLREREREEKDDSEESEEGAPGPTPRLTTTCFLTGRSLLELHPDGVDVRARLAHLRKKAAFVREIRIVDYGGQGHDGQPAAVHCSSCSCACACAHLKKEGDNNSRPPPPPPPFDLVAALALIPALVETLDTLDAVVSVVFESTDVFRPAVRLPDELWRWLERRKPAKVSFDGYFAFPDSLGWMPPVGSMSLVMNEEASRVLEVVRPAHLDIRVDTTDRSENSFKEIFEPYPALDRLDVRFQYYDDGLPRGYFDFTAHPEIRLSIHMVVPDTDAYIEDPGAWEETEERLKEIFVDDFSKLDVRRDVASETLVISRPLPGQKKGGGVRALHLPKHDDEGEEESVTVLAFEQAVLAALSAAQSESESDSESDHRGQRLERGRPIIDAAFWSDLDGVFATVYHQTFEALAQSA